MTNDFQAQAEKRMAALEGWLAPIFAKAPHLPPNIRQTLTKIAPWLALIGGILGVLGFLSAGAFGSIVSLSFLGMGMVSITWYVAVLIGLIAAVLDLLAYKPLSKMSKKGWDFLFYGTVLMTASSIIDIAIGYGMTGNLIGDIVGLWLLFEVREMYR